jgi:hypothetical protein
VKLTSVASRLKYQRLLLVAVGVIARLVAAAPAAAQSAPAPTGVTPAPLSSGRMTMAVLNLAEPDFVVVNLPTTLRLPRFREQLSIDPSVRRQLEERHSSVNRRATCSGSIRARSSGSSTGSPSPARAGRLLSIELRQGRFSCTASTTPLQQQAIDAGVDSRQSSRSRAPTTSRRSTHRQQAS